VGDLRHWFVDNEPKLPNSERIHTCITSA
jgi:hypothetical protein